jgi:hypothetical protein
LLIVAEYKLEKNQSGRNPGVAPERAIIKHREGRILSDYPKTVDYKKDIEVDQNNLELECVRHARMTTDYTDFLAQAIFDRDKAKEALEVNEATLDQAIRAAAATANEKVTEAVVKNRMILNSTHQKAIQALIDADYVVNILKGAVKGCDKKGDRITDLIRLFGMKYYAEPYDGGSDIKAGALDQGRLAATAALKKSAENPTPPATRDKDGHRYAIGLVQVQGAFTAGPWPELQQALNWKGEIGQGIYRLTREQPDELMYVWISDASQFGWDKVEVKPEAPKSTSLPPRPPARPPLLKRS